MQQLKPSERIRSYFITEQGKYKQIPLNAVWRGMKIRCLNPKYPGYHRYGGRGITICNTWKNDFQTFARWAMSHGYRQGLQIDRTDNNKGYNPSNCRFVTCRENNSNRGDNTEIVGVGWQKARNKWRARIRYADKTHYLGLYDDQHIAAFAYELALHSIREVEHG